MADGGILSRWARANPRDSQWCPRGTTRPHSCSVPSVPPPAVSEARAWGHSSSQRSREFLGRSRHHPLLCAAFSKTFVRHGPERRRAPSTWGASIKL